MRLLFSVNWFFFLRLLSRRRRKLKYRVSARLLIIGPGLGFIVNIYWVLKPLLVRSYVINNPY